MMKRPIRFAARAFLFLAFGVIGLGFWTWATTPNPSSLQTTNPKITRFMERLCQGGGTGCRISWTPLEAMSPFVSQAVILAEDMRFYQHGGLDLPSLVAAIKTNWKSGKIVWGGSTITQQLAKNLYLDPDKTAGRKLKEIALALKLERNLSKKRILEIYLNVAQWGPVLFGIDNASRVYFKKSPSELSPLEASYLVSILPNPEHATEPAWKERFAEAGGHVFDTLIGGYLDFFTEKKTVANCQIPMEAGERRRVDFAIAKTFNQFWSQFLNKRRDEPSYDAFLKVLAPEEWAVIQGLLRPENKASGFDAFLTLVTVRQHDYCQTD